MQISTKNIIITIGENFVFCKKNVSIQKYFFLLEKREFFGSPFVQQPLFCKKFLLAEALLIRSNLGLLRSPISPSWHNVTKKHSLKKQQKIANKLYVFLQVKKSNPMYKKIYQALTPPLSVSRFWNRLKLYRGGLSGT